MSRIGKKPIVIPEKTQVICEGNSVLVKGPLGELRKEIHEAVAVAVSDGIVQVSPKNNSKLSRSLWGTFASHIQNMVRGVNTKYEKNLELHGVGYKVEQLGNEVKLSVGFSHPVLLPIPKTLTVTVEKNLITVSGIDKEEVGHFAATIRSVKKPEPYKGKGIRYAGEYVREKQGKKAAG